MNHQQIMSLYQEVAVITDQMLAAARTSDWDTLISLESSYASRIDEIKINDARHPLSVDERQQKIILLKKILADDSEIRAITEPRITQLAFLLSSTGNERKLNNAYNASSTG